MKENYEIVAAYRRRSAIRDAHRRVKRQLKELHAIEVDLAQCLEWIRDTTHIIDGVALSIDGASVRPVSEEENPRWTEHYTNVNDGRTGLRLNVWRDQGGYDHVAINTSMGARIARRVAIAYVLRGEIPSEKGWINRYPYR